MVEMAWQQIAAEKRRIAASKIPPAWLLPTEILASISEDSPISVTSIPRSCGLLSETELDITENYSAVGLLQKLASAELSAVEVTTAFCKRAAIAQQLTNCLTETMFDQASARAVFLDEYLKTSGKVYGPLHGLPISIKDSFNVVGVPSTLGYLSFVKKPLPEVNTPLVDVLLNLGAVLYVKTNVPQTLMVAESVNNLFGRTLNPHKLTLTAGGSSGGEGALIGLRGSILGVGTDIGGSIRIPAFCCGTYGFKPSVNRVPYAGQTGPSRTYASGVKGCAGPLATTVEDMKLFMTTVIGAKPWNLDSTTLAAPWRDIHSPKKLNLGFILEDPEIPISPPIARALKCAVKKLEAAGHKVTPLLNFPPFLDLTHLCWRYFSADPKKTSLQHIKDGGEPMVKSVAVETKRDFGGAPTMDDLFDMNTARRAAKEEWRKIFVDNGFDAVMLPVYQNTAPPHDTYGESPYTSALNLLDFPGSTIPFLAAEKLVDVGDGSLKFYNAEDVDGAPCSIQLMGRNLHDEELLDVTQIVADILG